MFQHTLERVSLVLAICVGLAAASVTAHHGTNISYDRATSVTLTGKVSDFWYRNPHPALFVDVTDKDGKSTRWTIEIAPTPYTLSRAGWNKRKSEEALKAGTVVTMTIFPGRAGTPSGLLQSVKNEQGVAILGDATGAPVNP